MKEFEGLRTEFEDQVPKLQSKFNHSKSQITILHKEIEEKCTKNRKRGPPEQYNNQSKKQKEQL